MSITATVIPAHGDITETTLHDQLEDLQRLVGGYFQVVPLPVEGLNAFVNEEGKIYGLPINPRATLATRGTLMRGDYIAGTMVVLGPVDEDGEHQSADPDAVARLLDPDHQPAA